MEEVQKFKIRMEANRVFTPSAPVDEKALFAGRAAQVNQVLDAVTQRGQHAIIHGERGVGKTSLANVLAPWLEAAGQTVLAPHVNCDGSDTFSSIWRKIFSEIHLSHRTRRPGFLGEEQVRAVELSQQLSDPITPDDVRKTLASIGWHALLIMIVDEFDRVTSSSDRKLFADTIKTLSDHSVRATVVLVGVADDVDHLIEEHQSIQRAIIQIHLPRMAPAELKEIVRKGLQRLDGMDIESAALERIALLSQGLPHYTHLLALHAVRAAIDRSQKGIMINDVDFAIKYALDGAQQTIRHAYHSGTASPQRGNLYTEVLLACALARTDEMGYFAAADVRGPIRQVTGKDYDIPSFAQHLNAFCENSRGPVLQKSGVKHRFRFRFCNPLMQPYVIMRGFAEGRLKSGTLGDPERVG